MTIPNIEQLFLNSVGDYGMIRLNADGVVQSWNRGAENIYGYTADEIVGKDFAQLYSDAYAGKKSQLHLEEARANGQWREEIWQKRKSGQQFWAIVAVYALVDDAQKLYGFGTIICDIEQKRLQEQEDQAISSERLRLGRKREDFMLNLAHDMKTPLIGSNRMLEAIINGLVEPDDFIQICKRLKESNNTMLRMVWNTLELFRSESGEIVPVFHQVDLHELTQACLQEFQFLAGERKISFDCQVKPDTIATTDRLLLRRVLVNLIDNALKNTPPGGAVTVRATTTARGVDLQVSDTGVGITQSKQKRLFVRFSGLESRSRGGSGIGLFLCKQLCDAIRASITFSTRPGEGTTFTISLPADPEHAGVPQPNRPA